MHTSADSFASICFGFDASPSPSCGLGFHRYLLQAAMHHSKVRSSLRCLCVARCEDDETLALAAQSRSHLWIALDRAPHTGIKTPRQTLRRTLVMVKRRGEEFVFATHVADPPTPIFFWQQVCETD